jgi:hypothetical protein
MAVEKELQAPKAGATNEDYAHIKARLTELIEILLEAVAQDPESQSMGLQAMGPIILLMIQNHPGPKLTLLLTSLAGIAQAVYDLDCSQDEYEDRMVPLIGMLEESLK